MNLAGLELGSRILGLLLCVLLVVLLARTQRGGLRKHSAIGLAASVGTFFVTSASGASGFLGAAVYPLTALCSTHPVWFWICASALFEDHPVWRRRHVLSLVAMASLGVTYQSGLPGDSGSQTTLQALGIAFGAATLLFAALAPWSVYRGMGGDLDERRRYIRARFVPAASVYLAVITVTQVFVLLRGGSTPTLLVLLNLLVLISAAGVGLASFLRITVNPWMDTLDARPAVALTRAEQVVLAHLQRRFVAERLFARPSLTLGELAGLLDTQDHILRRVINYGLGFRNFNDFLHRYRLAEVAVRLRDPAAARIPVLTLALEAGYGSIGPFNRAFRERFGMTPTEYRRAPEPQGLPLSDSA